MYESVVSRIRRVIVDPAPSHPRVRAVYAPRWPREDGVLPPSLSPRSSPFNPSLPRPPLSRADEVLLAQLRCGHCPRLAAYAALYRPGVNEVCPSCRQAPQTLEHWLRTCDALAPTRLLTFGAAAPPLSVLATDPLAVVAFARATLRPR